MNSQPNILFIFSDQQRWDTLGCYGQRLAVTPNLDRLAAEGVRIANAFTCQPVCGPARACLQTGKYATEMGTYRNGIPLPDHERTMAHALNDVGYDTAYIGKWHLAYAGPDEDYSDAPIPVARRGGYRDFWLASDLLEYTSHGYGGHLFNGNMERVNYTGYRVDALTDFAIDYLHNRDKQNPFFLFLSFIEPHHQNDHNHFEGPNGSKERFANYDVPGDLIGTTGDWQAEYPDYLGCCNSLDYNVGRLREELEATGQLDNTLIIYTCDHGCHFRTRNSEYKRSCHDSCIHIPMILRGPGFNNSSVIEDMVNLIDVTPTVLSAAGIIPSATMRGRPLQELTNGDCHNWPKDIFLQISEDHIGRAIRTKEWKYSIWVPRESAFSPEVDHPGSDFYHEECLYDLLQDPHERNNLVNNPAYTSIRSELAAKLINFMRDIGEKAPVILPAVAASATL